jgi:hypothetical protein
MPGKIIFVSDTLALGSFYAFLEGRFGPKNAEIFVRVGIGVIWNGLGFSLSPLSSRPILSVARLTLLKDVCTLLHVLR